MNVAVAMAAYDLYWHEIHACAHREKGHQHFRFHFKPPGPQGQGGPSRQMNYPKPRLSVRQKSAGAPRNDPAHCPVHPAPQPRQFPRLAHAVADDHFRARSPGAPQQRRQIFWRVLSVAIQRHRPLKTGFQRMPEPGLQGRSFARIPRVFQYHRARRLRQFRRPVSRAVIHDEHDRRLRTHRLHERGDFCRLVQAGNNHSVIIGSIHRYKLKCFARQIERNLAARASAPAPKPRGCLAERELSQLAACRRFARVGRFSARANTRAAVWDKPRSRSEAPALAQQADPQQVYVGHPSADPISWAFWEMSRILSHNKAS